MRVVARSLVAAALAVTSSGSQAAWEKASSTHFVIYGDINPKALVQYAGKLERFDQAVRYALQLTDPKVGDRNRVTVFLMPNAGSIQKLAGNKDIAGFYIPKVTGPVALVPQELWVSNDPNVDLVFFHEYAHHLTMEDLDRPYPQWLVEGLAEFLSTAEFKPDGTVILGAADTGRAFSLFHGSVVPLQVLLAGDYSKLNKEQMEASVYAEGWLLTHYLIFDDNRSKQLNAYLDALAKGAAPLDAARSSFGDLERLQHDLNIYLGRIQTAMSVMKVPPDKAQPGPVAVTALSAGAAEVMPLRIRLKAALKPDTSDALAASIRAVASRYPGDELVEATLAEAELNAGHADAAQAAATRALAANPRNTEALVLKGRAIELKAKAADAEARKPLFDQARDTFMAANKIDTEDPDALFEYYRSFVLQGVRPDENALAALHYASDLAPQDFGVRMSSAVAYLNEGKLPEARSALTVVAYSPHAGTLAETARHMIADIDSGHRALALQDAFKSAAPPQAH